MLVVRAVAQGKPCVRTLCSESVHQSKGVFVLIELANRVAGERVKSAQERL